MVGFVAVVCFACRVFLFVVRVMQIQSPRSMAVCFCAKCFHQAIMARVWKLINKYNGTKHK